MFTLFVSCRERKTSKQPQKKEVYIKKPLNAFMLFMKEQRPTVSPAIRWKGSGVVNAFLATVVSVLRVWHSLCSCWFSQPEKYLQCLSVSHRWHWTVLCPQWKSMSAKEQEKYYLAAEKERLLHQQQYPGWSNKDNYVSPPWSHMSRAEEALFLLVHHSSKWGLFFQGSH